MRKLSVLLMLLGLLLTGCSQEPVQEPIVNEETEQVQSVVEKEIVKEYHYYIKETDTVFPLTEYHERYLAEKHQGSKEEIIELYSGMPPTYYITGKEYIDGKIVVDSILKNRELLIYDLGYDESNKEYDASYIVFEDGSVYIPWYISDDEQNQLHPEYMLKEMERPWVTP